MERLSIADPIASCILSGNKAEAISIYAGATGATLLDAAAFVHHMIARHSIYAIKTHRSVTGCRLIPAAMLVESIYGKIGARPEGSPDVQP